MASSILSAPVKGVQIPKATHAKALKGSLITGILFSPFEVRDKLIGQVLLNLLLETGTGVLVDEVTFFVHEPHGRNAAYAMFLSQTGLPAFSVEELGPGHVVLGQEILEFLLITVQGYTDDLKAFLVQFVIGLLDTGNLAYARSAPSGPKSIKTTLPFILAKSTFRPSTALNFMASGFPRASIFLICPLACPMTRATFGSLESMATSSLSVFSFWSLSGLVIAICILTWT